MDRWKIARLIACIAIMLALLALGLAGRWLPKPVRALSVFELMKIEDPSAWYQAGDVWLEQPRSPDPFVVLRRQMDPPRPYTIPIWRRLRQRYPDSSSGMVSGPYGSDHGPNQSSEPTLQGNP